METILKFAKCIGSVIHWLTGWIVHPGDGGCHHTDLIKDKINTDIENLKK